MALSFLFVSWGKTILVTSLVQFNFVTFIILACIYLFIHLLLFAGIKILVLKKIT